MGSCSHLELVVGIFPIMDTYFIGIGNWIDCLVDKFMRSLSNIKKTFYIKRVWIDGDTDYFKVIGVIEDIERKWLVEGPYIRANNIIGKYYLLEPDYMDDTRYVFSNDYRVEDSKISKRKFEEIKKLV